MKFFDLNDLIKTFPVDTLIHHSPTGSVSQVFIGYKGTIEPFVQLRDFDKNNYKKISYEDVLALAST